VVIALIGTFGVFDKCETRQPQCSQRLTQKLCC